MEVVAGALPSVITRLGELLADDFSLLKEVKREIMFVRSELESMLAFVQKISMTPEDRLDEQDKIWANEVRDMSYHVEGAINKFMAQFKGRKPTKHHGFKEAIDSSVEWLMQPMTRRKFAKVIRDIVSHVKKVAERRERYMIGNDFAKPVPIYPRLLTLHQMERELVGIREAAGEVIKILQEGNEVSNQQDKIVSIVGFGGLGKTALANVVYEKLRAQFDCSAFVPVSQTPDMDKLLKAMVFELEGSNRGTNVFEETFTIENIINELREFLGKKRYLLVIDDISDIKVWEMIKCALPNNNVGNKIITTTRIFSVAEQVGGAYKMKPLSLKNSRTLLYKRVFDYVNKDNKQNIEKYPDEALAEVSDKILKSCAGVPLAIIVKASLLVSLKERYSMEWYEAYDSICTGLETSLKMHSMRKILSFNYYDLPFHLRTCLLYLSMFPKDYNIDKNRLIWMWIAEDFIQCTEQGESLFELGENYFNELINRSMIQPTHTGTLEQCRVHNMMLDLISALSSDINFVTIDHTSLSNLIRRFSLQNGNEDHAMTLDNRNLLQVRSVIVFPSAVCPMPALGDFRLLFVLDLNDCDLSQSFNLKFLGNLFNLRYLGLSNTRITQLPEEVGNLEFLQTLNITCNEISSLPLTVVQLTQLMCLRIDMDTRVPNGIASLTSLEELSQIGIYNSRDIEMLCCLPRLRVLGLCCHNEDTDSFEKSLVECLNKLQYIQNLNIWVASNECKLDSFVAPPHLRRLSLRGCWLSTLPAWVHLSLLQHLSFLDLSVIELQEEGIIILGILRSLCYLNLKVDHENLGILRRFVIGADLFHCLLSCVLWGFRGPVIFQQGAMPCVTSLRFTLHVQDMREISGSSDGGYDLGLQNLSSLEDATILFRCGGTSDTEVEEVKVALRRVTKIHPNHPKIVIEGYEDKDE